MNDTTYDRLCLSMERMARRVSDLTGFPEKELMEWLKRDKQVVCYLTNNPVRMENSRKILARNHVGLSSITNWTENGFETQYSKYIFINCDNPEEYEGVHADCVILDYREPMITIAKNMIKGSDCKRLIDDRVTTTSDDVDYSLW